MVDRVVTSAITECPFTGLVQHVKLPKSNYTFGTIPLKHLLPLLYYLESDIVGEMLTILSLEVDV